MILCEWYKQEFLLSIPLCCLVEKLSLSKVWIGQLWKLIKRLDPTRSDKEGFIWLVFEICGAGIIKCKCLQLLRTIWVPLGHIYVSHETNANGLFSNTSYSGRAFERDPIIVPLKSPQSSLKSKTFSFGPYSWQSCRFRKIEKDTSILITMRIQ